MPTLRSLIVPLLAATLLFSGCAAYPAPSPQGPRPQAPHTPQQNQRTRSGLTPGPQPLTDIRPIQEHTVRYPSPRAGSAFDDPSVGIGVIASSVPGAGPVQAIALGNVALLGFPSEDPAVNHQIAQLIQTSFPHIAEVRVAHDQGTIEQLQAVTQRLMTNQPVSDLLPALVDRALSMPAVQ